MRLMGISTCLSFGLLVSVNIMSHYVHHSFMHVQSGKDYALSLMNSQFLKTWTYFQKQITMFSETNLKAGVLSYTFVLTSDGIKVFPLMLVLSSNLVAY